LIEIKYFLQAAEKREYITLDSIATSMRLEAALPNWPYIVPLRAPQAQYQ